MNRNLPYAVLMFILIPLLSEREDSVAWEPSNKVVFLQRTAGIRQENIVVPRSSGQRGVRGGSDYRESGLPRGNF
jgi:hypothetical protein